MKASVLLAAMLAILGCQGPKKTGKSPLTAPQMPPDSVVLEIFKVRYSFGDANINGPLWLDVDEQHIPTETRRRLTRNGFRAGLISGHIPMVLSELLDLRDKPARQGEVNRIDVAESDCMPAVVRRHMPLRAGRRGEIVLSEIFDELTVLLSGDAGLSGTSYRQAQAVMTVKAFPQPDGRVRVDLVPELYHDSPRQQFVGGNGVFRLETGRPSRVFEELAFSATLSPGSMLLVGSLPQLPGSLGHHFLTEQADGLQQELLLIRLVQTQHDGLFTPPEILSLDD